ncbi:MAG: HXXEE domain-containing protein [Lentimicrobiaceae bacterium]|nr:HXXEE domain-containing protein [Lentimicrobiaceae bacterium]
MKQTLEPSLISTKIWTISLPLLTFCFYNGIVHIFWTFLFKTYAPGVIFGFFIGVPYSIYIVFIMLKEKLVKYWYVLIFTVLSIFLIIQAMNCGEKLEPGVANAMLFSKKLANFLWF